MAINSNNSELTSKYQRYHDNNFADFENSKADDLVKTFSEDGITYNIESAEKFYNDNEGKSKVETVNGYKVDDMKNPKYNDKLVSKNFLKNLNAETLGNLILVDGIVTVGKGRYESHDIGQADPKNLPEEPGKVGDIHNHQGDKPFTLEWKGASSQYNFDPTSGPSRQDKGHSYSNAATMVVDKRYVYIVTGSEVIKHPR